MITYTVMGTDNVATPKQAAKLTLELMQKEVGGFVATVRLKDQVLLCDEDGLPRRLPVNQLASAIAGQQLVGTVVSVPRNKGWG